MNPARKPPLAAAFKVGRLVICEKLAALGTASSLWDRKNALAISCFTRKRRRKRDCGEKKEIISYLGLDGMPPETYSNQLAMETPPCLTRRSQRQRQQISVQLSHDVS